MSRISPDGHRNQPGPTVTEVVHDGVSALQMGNLEAAGRCFRRVLESHPQHPDACHLLAVVLLRQGADPAEAETLVQRALAGRPREAIFVNSLGTIHWRTNHLEEAGRLFEEAITIQPEYVDAHYNAGNVYQALRQFDRAVAAYRRVIELDPSYVNAHNDLGVVYHAIGRYDDAVECFTTALGIDPVRPDVYLNLANAYQSSGELDSACTAVHNAIALTPDDARAYNNLGTIHHELGNAIDAIVAFQSALELAPDSMQAAFNLGVVLQEQGRHEDAVAAFDRVLAKAPGWPSALVNKGNVLYKLARFDEAIRHYQEALRLYPGFAMAHLNLASTYRRMRELDKAVECFDRAIALSPDNPSAHFGKSLVLLKMGDMRAGWRHYEWRFEVRDRHFVTGPDLRQPEWRGQPIEGKTLIVLGEQGQGDVIHFVRYLPMVRRRCDRVVLSCPPGLMRLLEGFDGIDELVDRTRPWQIQCDFHVHLLSLPHVFGTTLDTIPGSVPYLFADDKVVQSWRARLDQTTVNVGLAWCGNPDQAENAYRSCPLSSLEPLWGVGGVTYYSLQKGAGAEELGKLPVPAPIVDYTDELTDFADTAALIRALDLVITVDTSVAHLAGALNAPVWTMLWFAHCWRYLQTREDSPWYPSMRLFRQPTIGDWPGVVARVRRELEGLVASR